MGNWVGIQIGLHSFEQWKSIATRNINFVASIGAAVLSQRVVVRYTTCKTSLQATVVDKIDA